jgi:metallo-beta-lactamase family protein
MKLKFLGAAGTVTGSKSLIETNGRKILVDCGLFQGLKALRLRNWEAFPVPASEIHAVILTHAHIDHSGYLPRLYREGFRGQVYCTPSTGHLAKILLMDSAHLMEEEARYANKRGFSKHKPALPLFTKDDAERVLELFRFVPFHAEVELAGTQGVKVLFQRAGHILGASSVRLNDGKTKITFSGDVGRLKDPIMPHPEPLEETDYLVVESTYGDRLHTDEEPMEQLRAIFDEVAWQKGSLLIPAFAVGRAQEILYYIMRLRDKGLMPNLPVYLDSPMANRVTSVFCEHLADHKLSAAVCERMVDGIHFIKDIEESIQLQSRTDPRIIISASGMATGGRVLHHLKKMAQVHENIVLFAGYQAAGTRGATLVAGVKEIKIHGEYVPVRASVRYLDTLSAHADYRELLQWLGGSTACKPKRVFVTHGEPAAADAFRLRLRDQMGWDAVVPGMNDEFKL